MSYVNKKIGAFREAGDIEVQLNRSDGRMKVYASATDARAWCDISEDRRQYILELVKRDYGKGLSLGRYVPVEAIIDVLLANKNADIERLQQEIAELKRLLKEHGPDNEEKPISVTEPEGPASAEVSPRYQDEDEKAAQELLAGKSPEDQVLAVNQALADMKTFYKSKHALALEAIEQLECIKDIIDGEGCKKKPSSAGSSKTPVQAPSNTISGSCKDENKTVELEIEVDVENIQRDVKFLNECFIQLASIEEESAELKKEWDTCKDGLTVGNIKDRQKLDEITKNRDGLRSKIQKLEIELLKCNNPPKQVGASRVIEGLKPDEGDLRKRLDRLKGLKDEVKKLEDRCTKCVGDSVEKDKLLTRITQLEAEAEECKCRLQEMNKMEFESNSLKIQCDDLRKVQKDYEELAKKTQGFDDLKAECAMYKSKYEEVMKEIEDCECCMDNQDDEIKRLTCHVECLTQELDDRQDAMKYKVLMMCADLEKNDTRIEKSEQHLADVQQQLRSSIESLSCCTICLRTRIQELENEISGFQKTLIAKDEVYKSLETKYNSLISIQIEQKDMENVITSLQENNKALLEKIETDKNTISNLEESLRKAKKSDERLKQMLKQATCTIKCITQKLENHELVGVDRLEAERKNYLKKIKELEEGMAEGQRPCGAERILELQEALMKSNANNKCLRDTVNQLRQVMDENESLRKIITQLQETAGCLCASSDTE
ncbi:myosin-8-like [Zophobas morio]|uniref:myosin-8-like n=1 Tax=Zophobas morio TaxID=2755281 RepID=UPI003082AFC7